MRNDSNVDAPNGTLAVSPAGALHLPDIDGADPADLRLVGLAVAAVNGMVEEQADPDTITLDPVPIYVRLERSLRRRKGPDGEPLLDRDVIAPWPSTDW